MIRVSVSSNLKIIVLIKQRFVSAYLKLFNDQSILKRTVSRRDIVRFNIQGNLLSYVCSRCFITASRRCVFKSIQMHRFQGFRQSLLVYLLAKDIHVSIAA